MELIVGMILGVAVYILFVEPFIKNRFDL